MVILYAAKERQCLARVVFTAILLSLLYAFFTDTLLHQLQQPVIRFPYIDITYWLMHGLGIPELATGKWAWVFDVLLVGSCIGCLWTPDVRGWAWAFLVLYFIYFISCNTYGTLHASDKTGILLIVIPFLVRDLASFNYLWQGLRYVLLFAFSSAFLWKLLRLSWLQPNQGLLIMKKNWVQYLYHNPDTVWANVLHWLLAHPVLVNGLFVAGFLLEGVFIVGFFTRKYDKWLLVTSVLLVLGFWVTADAHFIHFLILCLTLAPFRKVHATGIDRN
jgi:hypothetical protein